MLKPQTAEPPIRNTQPVEIISETTPESGHDRIVELLGATPTGVDELVRECHMSAAAVQSALLELELAGRIERHPGNRISLVL
jgi:DNA processing protein